MGKSSWTPALGYFRAIGRAPARPRSAGADTGCKGATSNGNDCSRREYCLHRKFISARRVSARSTHIAASEDSNVVVCVRPGTELSFAREVMCQPIGIFGWRDKVTRYKTAIFRQIN